MFDLSLPVMLSSTLQQPIQTALDETESAVVRTLLYFGIFRHPLTREELHVCCQQWSTTSIEIDEALAALLTRGLINEADGFFFIGDDASVVAMRRERNQRADNIMPRARRNAQLIAKFPFVRGVALSGSLSKGTLDADGDVDYFILTEPRRLWICRSMLVLYKKIFRFNSRKYFCVNYFIDTQHLEIPDRNLFVATEVFFLRPLSGTEMFDVFFRINDWTKSYYSGRQPLVHEAAARVPNGFFKRVAEKICSGRFGEWLDERLFRITLRRWEKKFPHINREQFDLNFRSRKTVSKHHPQGFQWKVKTELHQRLREFSQKHDLYIVVPDWESAAAR